MRRADHPRSCRVCHGTGWAPADYHPRHGHWTYRPCTHHWADDDTGWREENQPIPFDDPRAQAAFWAGYRQGQAELWELSDGKLGTPPDDPTPTLPSLLEDF
jgi:hypothetical protein